MKNNIGSNIRCDIACVIRDINKNLLTEFVFVASFDARDKIRSPFFNKAPSLFFNFLPRPEYEHVQGLPIEDLYFKLCFSAVFAL